MSLALVIALDQLLAERRPDYYQVLIPGVDDHTLDQFDAVFDFELPAAFRELYRWRNGQPDAVNESLYDNWMFMSLTDIARTKEELDGMIGLDFDDPRYWRRGWVPFLHNGGGSYLCIDFQAEDGGRPGQIIGFWKADEDRPIYFPNFEAWLENVVAKRATPYE